MKINHPYLRKQMPVMLHLLQAVFAAGIQISLETGSHCAYEEEAWDINNLELSLTACYSVFISKRGL